MSTPSGDMNDFLAALERRLNPPTSWGEFRRGARAAAVVLLLHERGGEWSVPFVRRRADLADHPGQIALPGGGVAGGETAWGAAERELEEELGIPRGHSRPVGAATVVYTAVSNFSVVPFVAVLERPDPVFRHDPGELEGVLEVPLHRLLAESSWTRSRDPWPGSRFPWQGALIWGLTARILDDLLARVKSALDGAGRSPGRPAPPARG